MENGIAGIETTPEKNNAHKIGRLKPDKHANPKNGRNPTSHSGCADNFILPPCCRIAQTVQCVRPMDKPVSSRMGICVLELIEAFDHFPFTKFKTTSYPATPVFTLFQHEAENAKITEKMLSIEQSIYKTI